MGLPQHKTSNVINVDYGTNFRITNKSVLKAIKTAKGDVIKRLEEMDNTQKQSIDTTEYLKLICKITEYRFRNGLTYQAVELLLYVYFLYMDINTGVTAYGISKLFADVQPQHSSIQNNRNKLDKLVGKGLLTIIGVKSNRSNVYIPSDKAIKDINAMRSV